ncbi:MAG: 3-dehydroquinate synthase [Synechococcaceae cyanobacterium RL_1_2]|nr:3-dehydroquinate synthase [Synechococcaceae cyanobacterium RL_1_2]
MNTSTITIDFGYSQYDITLGSQSLEMIGAQLQRLNLGQTILLISNPEIFDFYGDRVLASLAAANFKVDYHLVPAGEQYKHVGSIQQIYDRCIESRLERSSTLLALGGGVIGDMTGFAAATWLRGVNFVQVPTSLLAMVDASVGGKTGVNHPQGKNLIGAFYQPRQVIIDPSVLKTLPVREFRAGMAEVIKYGVIWDRELFEALEQADAIDELQTMDEQLLSMILARSCQAKADVVSQDEKEGGIRAILNYGHTIGHAIESLTNYDRFVHGEAVAIGMVAAGAIAVALNLWSEEEQQRQINLIQKASLPTNIPSTIAIAALIEALNHDKKVKAGKVRYILPTTLGEAIISDQVTTDLLTTVLPSLQG